MLALLLFPNPIESAILQTNTQEEVVFFSGNMQMPADIPRYSPPCFVSLNLDLPLSYDFVPKDPKKSP